MEQSHGIYLIGMEIDWVEGLDNRGFTFTNPNATPVYEKNLGINFGIVGFGTTIGSDSSAAGVDSAGNALGYGRPFFLNN